MPPKYYLSAEACNGILRRAERRRRALPPTLLAAIKYQREHYDEIIRWADMLYHGEAHAEIQIYDARGNGNGTTAPTITGDHQSRITDYTGIVRMSTGQTNADVTEDISPWDISPCLTCNHEAPIIPIINDKFYFVRRLTPLECERLQGLPDGWTDIPDYIDSKGRKRKASDSVRYKAIGNGIAVPPWDWVLKRVSAQFERPATLGSLFDGIGTFPLIWERGFRPLGERDRGVSNSSYKISFSGGMT